MAPAGGTDAHRLTSACLQDATRTNPSRPPDHVLHLQAPCLCRTGLHLGCHSPPTSLGETESSLSQVQCHGSGRPPSLSSRIKCSFLCRLLLCWLHGCTGGGGGGVFQGRNTLLLHHHQTGLNNQIPRGIKALCLHPLDDTNGTARRVRGHTSTLGCVTKTAVQQNRTDRHEAEKDSL